MAGRRQLWTGITPLPLMFLLALVLPASVLLFSHPAAGWEAATLVATAIVLSLCATRAVIVPSLSAVAGSMTGPANATTLVPSRLSPDAPGQPRPRAPGDISFARPA